MLSKYHECYNHSEPWNKNKTKNLQKIHCISDNNDTELAECVIKLYVRLHMDTVGNNAVVDQPNIQCYTEF